MGRKRSPVKQTNRHVKSWSLFQATFSPSPEFIMKKKRIMKGRSSNAGKKCAYSGRGPSNKLKHSKVAKLIKLAKMRAKKSKATKVVSKKKKR